MLNLPNTLSLSRMMIAPFLLYLAWINQPRLLLFLLLCSFITDLLDGFLARKRREESELGAKLDSWGDFATYVTLPICAWWLWPHLIRREALFVGILVASYIMPILLGFLKYSRLTSYHTWGAKLAWMFINIGILLLLMFQIVWPFRIAAIVLALSAIEEIAVTITLPKWQSDVPSLWHAIHFTHHQNANP